MSKSILKVYIFHKDISEINFISKKKLLVIYVISQVVFLITYFIYMILSGEKGIGQSFVISVDYLFENFVLSLVYYFCQLLVYVLFISKNVWFALLKEVVFLNFIRPLFLIITLFFQNFFFDLLFPLYCLIFIIFFSTSYIQEHRISIKKTIFLVLLSSLLFIVLIIIFNPLLLINI